MPAYKPLKAHGMRLQAGRVRYQDDHLLQALCIPLGDPKPNPGAFQPCSAAGTIGSLEGAIISSRGTSLRLCVFTSVSSLFYPIFPADAERAGCRYCRSS